MSMLVTRPHPQHAEFERGGKLQITALVTVAAVLLSALALLLAVLFSGTTGSLSRASGQLARNSPVTAVATLTAYDAPVSASRTWVVRPGNTLGTISAAEYGISNCWQGIWRANYSVIGGNPDIIYVGRVLTIPAECSSQAPTVHMATAAPAVSTAAYTAPAYYDPANSILSESQIEQLWVSVGGPTWAEYSAYRVAMCESGGNRYAYNPSGATGVWQILGSVIAGNLNDARVNALNAVSKFHASGNTFAQWVCQP